MNICVIGCLFIVLGAAVTPVQAIENLATEHSDRTANDFLIADRLLQHSSATSHVRIYGQSEAVGAYVVIIPSLGRGVEDYTEAYNSTITTRLVEAGYRVVLIQPRGIGKSTGDLTPQNASMSLFAQDIRSCLGSLEIGKANFVGHAFGNRLARTFASLYPQHVDDLVLLAAGGNFELDKEQIASLRNSFDPKLADKERLKAIKRAFFAEGNDPSVWLNGWYPDLAAAQVLSARMINGDFFKRAGGKDFLLIQAQEDFIAPPEKAGRVLKSELPEQVTYVEIPNTGHALSSERPDEIAAEIIRYFSRAR